MDEPTSSTNSTSDKREAEENVADVPQIPNNSKPPIPDAFNNIVVESVDRSSFGENSRPPSVIEADAQVVIRKLKTDDL